MNMFQKNSYVMNTKTGSVCRVCTGVMHSRDRYSVVDSRGRVSQVAFNHLVPVTNFEAELSMGCEKIVRWKKAQTAEQRTMMKMWRNLKARLVG